jgi:hypothetical protein
VIELEKKTRSHLRKKVNEERVAIAEGRLELSRAKDGLEYAKLNMNGKKLRVDTLQRELRDFQTDIDARRDALLRQHHEIETELSFAHYEKVFVIHRVYIREMLAHT